MRVVYMYHQDDPQHGSVVPGSLPNPQLAFKGYIPLSLLQRAHDEQKGFEMANKVHSIELRNEDVTLPEFDETLHWCNVFDLNDIRQKQHIIKVCDILYHRCCGILIYGNVFVLNINGFVNSLNRYLNRQLVDSIYNKSFCTNAKVDRRQ